MNDRRFWIGFLLLVSVALAVPKDTASVTGLSSVMTSAAPARLALAASSQEPAIDVKVAETDRGTNWHKNPLFVGAGVIALVLLVAAARRDGSTSIVDNRVRNRRSSR